MVLRLLMSLIKEPFWENKSLTLILHLSLINSKLVLRILLVFPLKQDIQLKPPYLLSLPIASRTSQLYLSNQGMMYLYHRFKIPELDALASSAPVAEEAPKKEAASKSKEPEPKVE